MTTTIAVEPVIADEPVRTKRSASRKTKAKAEKPAKKRAKRGVVEMVQVYKDKKEALLRRTAALVAKYDSRINTLEAKYAARLKAAELIREKGSAEAAKEDLDAQIRALRKQRALVSKL